MKTEIDKSQLKLIPAVGLSCQGCELFKYNLQNPTSNGQIAKCIEMMGDLCLNGFIWTKKYGK